MLNADTEDDNTQHGPLVQELKIIGQCEVKHIMVLWYKQLETHMSLYHSPVDS